MNRDREAIARIIAGFRAPVAADGPTAHHIWNRALAKADRILALPGEWRDRATRAEAHAERLASALEFITDERVDRENITTAQLEGLRQALSDYNQRAET